MLLVGVLFPRYRDCFIMDYSFGNREGSTGSVGTETPRTILLVDDEADIRRLLKLVLTCHGFTVHAASCGREAVELYRQHPLGIDLVLLDVIMPGRSGYDLCREITKVPGIKTSVVRDNDFGATG